MPTGESCAFAGNKSGREPTGLLATSFTIHGLLERRRGESPEEAPVHRVTVGAFWIDRTPVTNREFRTFVNAAGHVTLH
jgi:formylglycine-generating enzyme required for sulfatase activity